MRQFYLHVFSHFFRFIYLKGLNVNLACVMRLYKNANHISHCLIYIFVYIMCVDKT